MDTRQTRSAIFGDIRQVAERERLRLLRQDEEPAELRALRAEAEETARQILADARAQAEQMRETARQQGLQVGYSEGHATGMTQALAEMEQERAQYRADIEAFVARIEEERQRIWQKAEPQIIDFVLEIAQKVVKDDAAVNRDIALSIIRNALRRVVDTETIRIRVNIDDLETVRSSREELTDLVDGIDHLDIVEDRRVAPGGCIVETSSGAIDARLETQFTEIKQAIRTPADAG